MKGQQLGFIGTGIMGTGMVQNLMKGGYEVHLWNRTKSKCQALLDNGATWCASPSAMAEEVDCILLCLSNGQVVEEVIFGDEGITQSEGEVRMIIDHSTIAPAQAKGIAKELESMGVSFLDAPVSGGDVGAREGTLTIMVGGKSDVVEEARNIFTWTGQKIFHTGPSGSGQLTKCVNQLVVAVTVSAMTEGLVFAEDAGLDPQKTLDVISSGAAGSWALDNYAPRILAGDLNPGFYAKDMLKDLRIALAEADAQKSTVPVSALVKELYAALCYGGDEELGNHALIRLYERMKPKR